MSSSNSDLFSSDLIDNDLNNHSISTALFPWNDTWILPIFILCSIGILCTIIISLIFICLSSRRLNGHFLLTNLFLCFSITFIYIILIIFLIRANELLCGLRELFAQFAYALLYSALLCQYIMQWLGSRILSKRTKKLTSLLIYLLLIFIQIPIGILWWHFTIPRACQQRRMNILSSSSSSKIPKFHFHIHQPISSSSALKPCSHRCIVDYRFYATFTYPIIELFLCTIIATCLFLCRHCHRTKTENDQEKIVSVNGNNPVLNFLNMFAFILIDLIWLTWTLIYYFTHPFFIFPALILSMFSIATICLLLILLPHVYYYSKLKLNDIDTYKTKTESQPTTLYSNKLAATDEINDQELLLEEKSKVKKQQNSTNENELSYELGESGTFLPITRTPRGPFKVSTPLEKLDNLIYGEQHESQNTSNYQKGSNTNEIKVNASLTDVTHRQDERLQPPLAPLQRQSTSSSIASDFVTPVSYRNPNADIQTSSSMYYSAYPPTHRDETIIPILCTSERPRTSTPVQMRILVNSPSSSVPTTRRIHSGSDLRYIRQPYPRVYPPPPPPPVTPPYYSPQPQQYLFVDPYRTMPSRIGGNTWHSVLLQPGSNTPRYSSSSSYRRIHTDHRSLSQRLWDIDSGDDDEDDMEEDIIKVAGRDTPPPPPTEHFNNHRHHEDNILLHIDDDDDEEEENSYKKQYAHV